MREYRALIQTIGSEILSRGTRLSLFRSLAASLSLRGGGLIWGVRNNTTGVKILGIPAAIQSLSWRERGRGRGGARKEQLVGCTNFLVHCTVKLAEWGKEDGGRNGIEEERAIEYV